MFKIRGGLAVIVAAITGIVLLIIAFNDAQEAIQIKSLRKDQVFAVAGRPQFTDRLEEKLYRPKKDVYVQLRQYPALFMICRKSPERSAASFADAVDTAAIRLLIPREAMASLFTRSTIKVYELAPINGQPVFSFEDASKRYKGKRSALYVRAAICFIGGLVLLVYPKKYLLKE